jgi:hypothetical protein
MIHGVGRDADYVADVIAQRASIAAPALAHAPGARGVHAAA